jgi:hypothetical protein
MAELVFIIGVSLQRLHRIQRIQCVPDGDELVEATEHVS